MEDYYNQKMNWNSLPIHFSYWPFLLNSFPPEKSSSIKK
jgi:hypothetical protein